MFAARLLAPRADTVALEVIGVVTGAHNLPKSGSKLVNGQDAATAMVKRIDSAMKHHGDSISDDARKLLTRARHGLDVLARDRSARYVGEDSWFIDPHIPPSLPCPDWTGKFTALKRELEPAAQAVFTADFIGDVQERHRQTSPKLMKEEARHDRGLKIAMHMNAM